ncbi:nucleoside triphosphate pyrophosphohydrolase [Kribbella lupini]|uniref:House-cleaning noncanonical NTP pyrophosphatase (MazG superfamily) n=1 Tax=Kribbella lupini TaxID=291602 RepID=A0ABN2BZJ0_9ACTN
MRKLVRDRMPEIIRAKGEVPIVYQAEPDEYRRRLRDKLVEEVGEFLDEGEGEREAALEELADVLEVVHALAVELGSSAEELERIRSAKVAERGAFAERVIWSDR